MPDIVIRRAQKSDAAAMAAYVDAIFAEKLDTIGLNRSFSTEEEEGVIARANEAERAFFLLALEGERVVGMVDISAGDRFHNRHAGRLGMSVARDWRGRGLGRRLLEAGINETRQWPGFCRIELEVVPWNAAGVALYEKLGFVLEGRKKNATTLRGQLEDMLVMALTW